MIAGMMSIGDDPLSVTMAVKLSQLVDYMVIRYDVLRGRKKDGAGGRWHYELLRRTEPFAIPVDHCETEVIHKAGFVWREEMLRRLDHVRPEYVICMDADECAGPNFDKSMEWFKASRCDMLLFRYDMITVDGRAVPQTPKVPHCKAFRWVPGLTFKGAKGFGRPTFPHKPVTEILAKTKMHHYSFFTPEMQEEKLRHYLTFKKPHEVKQMFTDGGIEAQFEGWYATV